MDLYAYYPYAENADPTALVYDASVAEADFMTARTPGFSERDGEIRLVFRHKLALAEAFVADADKLTDYAVTVQTCARKPFSRWRPRPKMPKCSPWTPRRLRWR